MAVTHGEKICHLHLFHGEMQELALILLSKLCGRKVIVTVHDVKSFSPVATDQATMGYICRLADRLVVHNQVSKRELAEKIRVSPDRIEVIPSGNYLNEVVEKSDPVECKRNLGISETSRIILFLDRLKM